MINIKNLSLQFDSTSNSISQHIIEKLNVHISPGEKYFLMGENGVGKTSVLQEIIRQSFLPSHQSQASIPEQYCYLAQDMWDTINLDPQNIGVDYYSLMWQYYSFAPEHFRTKTIPQDDLDSWYSHAVSHVDPHFEQRLSDQLFQFDLSPGRLAHDFSSLSPGTQKKLLLSILIATNPSAIIVDELTNHLDKHSIELLKEIIISSPAAMLIVDHNQDFVTSLGKNWIHIPNNDERIPYVFKDISYEEYLLQLDSISTNLESLSRVTNNKSKQLNKALDLQTRRAEVFGINIGAAKKHIERRIKTEVVNNVIHSKLVKSHDVLFETNLEKNKKIRKDRLIGIKHLEYKIGTSKTQTIEEFKLYNGERLRVLGHNGSGKSTLISLIRLQLEKSALASSPQYITGEIDLNQQLELQSVFVFSQISAYSDDTQLYPYIGQLLKIQDYSIPGFLKKLALDHYPSFSLLSSLSLGELIRLQFGILASTLPNKNLIILDEPGNFLDITTQNTLIKLLNQYAGAVLLITHDDVLANRIGYSNEYTLD